MECHLTVNVLEYKMFAMYTPICAHTHITQTHTHTECTFHTHTLIIQVETALESI